MTSVALTLDGTGYGLDGKAWGGEVLRADLDSFDRIAHLQEIPLLGGEMAVRDPRRLVFALDELSGRSNQYFSDREAEVLQKIMPTSPGEPPALDGCSMPCPATSRYARSALTTANPP